MKTESEVGVMLPYTKEYHGLPATTRSSKREGKTLPHSFQRERGLANTLISEFEPPELGRGGGDEFLC